MRSTIFFGSTSASTPAGQEWHIGRRWVTRSLPRWRRVRAGHATAEALSVPDVGSPEDLATALAIFVGVVVFAVILIPLLLFGIELVILGFMVAAGVVGRGLLGRPWIVEAKPVNESTPAYAWKVSGWRRSVRLIDEAAAALSAGLDPLPAEAQTPATLTAPRP